MKDQAKQNKIRYNNAYNKKAYKTYTIRFSRKDDADIISFLEQFKVNNYITDLVRKKVRDEDQ